jgi:hypothetical protein
MVSLGMNSRTPTRSHTHNPCISKWHWSSSSMYLLIDLPKIILTHLLRWVKIVLGMHVISSICNSKGSNVINDHKHVCDDCFLLRGIKCATLKFETIFLKFFTCTKFFFENIISLQGQFSCFSLLKAFFHWFLTLFILKLHLMVCMVE